MAILLMIIVFTAVFGCRYYLDIQIKKGKIPEQNINKKKLIWDIVCAICSLVLVVFFGTRIYLQWQNDKSIKLQIVLYIVFVLGCVVHFYRIFKKSNYL